MHQAGPRRGVERQRHVGGDPPRVVDAHLRLAAQPVAQGLALDPVHHVVEKAISLAGRMHRDDPGMAELCDHPRLGEEATHDALLVGQGGVHHLDRDAPVERAVRRLEDDPHAPAPQLAVELVLRPQGLLETIAQVGPDRITHPRLHIRRGMARKPLAVQDRLGFPYLLDA